MHTKCKNTGICKIMSAVITMLLFVAATMFCVPSTTQNTYASGLTNPLSGYSTTEGFGTITGGTYDSATNPYKIETASDLIKLAYYVNVANDTNYATASYRMDSHISLIDYDWQPIGNETTPFSGVFDGYGYSIYGLTITTSTAVDNAGLFGYVASKTYNSVQYKPIIRLLGIKDASIESDADYVGSIAGRVVGDCATAIVYNGMTQVTTSALVQECYSVSFVKGSGIVGGLVGAISDGASIYNCYTAPSSNNVKTTDIVCTSATGSVGGIVGKVSYNLNNNPAVHNTYSTSAVANSTETANYVGGIVGDITDIGSYGARYNTNAFYANNVASSSDTVGRKADLGNLKALSTFTTRMGWSLVVVGDGEWTRYDRGDAPTSIWKLASEVNNGFPVLTRVPQLSKITLDASLESNNAKNEYVDYYFNGYKDLDNPNNLALSTLKPIVIDKHNMYIEQGKNVAVIFEYLEYDTRALYKLDEVFENIHYSSVVDVKQIEVGFARDSNNLNMHMCTIDIISSDATYTAQFVYEKYALNVGVNNVDFGKVEVKVSPNGEIGEIDWSAVAVMDDVMAVNRDSVIRIEAIPNKGYKIDSWKIDGSEISHNSTQFKNNAYIFKLAKESTIKINFKTKEYNFTIEAEDGQGAVADLSYTINYGPKQTTQEIDDMPYGSVVKLSYQIKDGYYSFGYWSIKADGLTEYNLNKTGDTFIIQDYNNYVVTAHFIKDNYLVNITTKNAQADISFGDGGKIQKYINIDETWIIKVNTIPEGYHFEKWDIRDNQGVVYNGDKDVTDREFIEVGINSNWTCEAVFALNEYDVVLVAPENATYANKEANTYKILYGDRFEVTVTPEVGYFLKQWVDENDNELGELNTLNIVITKNITIRPIINAKEKFSVLIYSELDDGKSAVSIGNDCYIQRDKDNKIANGKYDSGTDMTFEVVVPAGLQFVKYQLGTKGLTKDVDYVFEEQDGKQTGKGRIISIKQNIEIKCIFERQDITISFGINEAGRGNYVYNVGKENSNYLEQNELKAKVGNVLILKDPRPTTSQFVFAYWLINGKPYTNSEIDMTLNEDTQVIGVFDRTKYELKVTQNVKGGDITGFDTSTYYYGDTVSLSTSVLPGYRFVGWYNISHGEQQELTKSLTLDYVMQQHTALKAVYAEQGTVYAVLSDDNAGIVNGLGSFDIGKVIDLEVLINPDYEFLYWTKNGEIIGKDTTLTMIVTDEVNIVDVVFGALQNINVTVNNIRLGRATGVTNAKLGEEVTVKAVPAESCAFTGWWIGDDLISTDSNYTFVVNGSLSLEARFQEQINITGVILIVVGCVVFVILLIIIVVYFVKQNEKKKAQEPVIRPRHNVFEMYNVDNSDDYVSTRGTLNPIPVRKVSVPPRDYKGNIKTLKYAPVDVQEYKRGRGRPKGSLNKKGRKTIAPMYPGQRGRPKGSLNKKGRKVYELKAPGKRGRPLGSKNKPKF